MSKQIALLIDNSGSMFSPVAGGATHDKIYETARGAELFISNMITELAAVTASRFAFSVHRFAQSWQVLPGCGQLDNGGPGFGTGLAAMHDAIAAIEDQASSQAAVGNLTDLYGAVRQTSDYLIANTPSFGVPDARYVLVFSDGIQTIHHAGSLDRSGYESEQGVAFSSLLADRNVRLRAWGIGSDALAAALRDLTDQAVDPTAATETLLFHPGSYTKVLFPQSEGGTFANCTTIIAGSATALVDDNGILPLRPAGRPPSGLLWEQFSLPRIDKPASAVALVRINHGDFEVDVDGSTKVLILGLVAHAPGRPSLEAVSPGGRIFVPSASGTRIVESEGAMLFKIAEPEEGRWRVRVTGDPDGAPMILDLMARGAWKEFKLAVDVRPFQLPGEGEVTVKALPLAAGKVARGRIKVTAQALGGRRAELNPRRDGSFSGPLAIAGGGGIRPIRVELEGTLAGGRSIHRIEFAEVLLGRATDPRFTVAPQTYVRGGSYTVELALRDGEFRRPGQAHFGSGIQVTDYQILNATTARARIRVEPDAFLGAREVVTYNPNAESLGEVRVIEAKGAGSRQGRICCLQFDAAGRLAGVELCDGTHVCVGLHDERLLKILEAARDGNLAVRIHVDLRGCLTGIDVCR